MDSCGNNQEDQNWLAFSLSNQNYYATSQPTNHQTQQQENLCLFQHPISPGMIETGEVGHVVDNGSENNNQHHHELPFLGRGGGDNDGGMLQVSLFPVARQEKGIDARFLGGFSSEQQMQIVQYQEEQQRQLSVVAPTTAVVPISNNRKGGDGFGHRTSIYRGVTRHRWTGRYEAHLWDNSCRREGQSRKGRQVYLGGYDKEEKAARAYDLAALKYWGPTTTTNFPISDYEKELEEMKNMSRQEFVASLRRKSSGFSRGASIYRGVTRHHQHGRWQARIGRVAGNKDLYLGTFSTQEEAAEAYDIAAIKFRGLNAVTNFDISRYDVNSIISSNLPVGGMSNKPKPISDNSKAEDNKTLDTIKSSDPDLPMTILPHLPFPHHPNTPPTLNFALPTKPPTSSQSYELPALATYDHNNQGNAIEYGIGYGNDGTNQGYNGNNNDHVSEASGSSGNSWIVTQNLHSFQSPKPRLSVVHRAIFGIE